MEPDQYALMARVEQTHWWYAGMRAVVAALLTDALPARPRILDAGCGTGGTTRWLRRFGSVVGVDLAAEASAFWAGRGLRAARASVDALPFPAASFDLVTCFDVLYHRRVADEVVALREFWRVLRPGGFVLVRVPAYAWLAGAHDRAVQTRHRFTRGELVAALARAGFEVPRATYANSALLPLAVATRLGERWWGPSQTEMAVPPAPVNRVLRAVLDAEARLLRRWPLPAGLSVLALGRKPCRTSASLWERAA
jgi:SAM-dependent methyltransferase